MRDEEGDHTHTVAPEPCLERPVSFPGKRHANDNNTDNEYDNGRCHWHGNVPIDPIGDPREEQLHSRHISGWSNRTQNEEHTLHCTFIIVSFSTQHTDHNYGYDYDQDGSHYGNYKVKVRKDYLYGVLFGNFTSRGNST